MTGDELYDRIVFKVFGNSTPPAGTEALLKGHHGLIADAHRKIQQDYNYWFMQGWGYVTTDDDGGTPPIVLSTYNIPAATNQEYKEVIGALWKIHDKEYFSRPLAQVGTKTPINAFWQSEGSSAEYPEYYELYNGNIVLYPRPSTVDRVLHVLCWYYLARPTDIAAPWTVFDAWTDTLTQNGYDAIIAMVVAEMKESQEQFDQVVYWKQKAEEELERLKQMDREKRQVGLYGMAYSEV